MGQQQLLLIVLSVIVVGVAVVVGVQMFNASFASSNLEAVTSDLVNLASRAQQFYIKPGSLGGGNSFSALTADDAGINKLTPNASNDNGTYSISTAGNGTSVTLQGVGTQDGDGDGTNCTVRIAVFADSLATTVVNR